MLQHWKGYKEKEELQLSFIDIVRTLAILLFGVLSGWVIYRLMKSADANEESEESKDNEKIK